MASSCSSCISAGPESSPAIEGEIRTTGEYRQFSDKLYAAVYGKRVPISGSIELTENCNFRCIHCYQGKNKARKILSGDQWCNIIDQSVAEGTLWMLITGGEPLLHPEFERIYMYAVRSGLIITLFTNGRLITDRHIQLLKDYPPFSLEVTLYGASEETYKKVTGSSGAFERVLENVKKLKAAGIPLKLKSVAFKPLIWEMAAIKKIAEEEVGVKFRFDTKIDPGIYGDQFDDIRPTAEESVDLEEQLVGKKEIGVDLEAFMRLSESSLQSKNQDLLYQCGAGKNSFYIDYQGWMHACSAGRFLDEKLDVTTNSFRDIWHKEIPKIIFQEAKNKNAICRSCEFRPLCDVCPTTAKLATGDKEGVPLYICQHTMMRKTRFFPRKEQINEQKKEIAY